MKEKLRSPMLWASIISTLLLILSATGIINIEDSALNTITNSILSILSIMGIITSPSQSNPNDKNQKDS
ncbi:MAG: phage holin [Clostridia bacterium]